MRMVCWTGLDLLLRCFEGAAAWDAAGPALALGRVLWAGDAAARDSGAAGRLLGCGLDGSRDLLCTLLLLRAAAAAMELESPRCCFCFLELRFCIALLALLDGEGISAAARSYHKLLHGLLPKKVRCSAR